MGAIVTTGGDVRLDDWLVYTRGGGTRFGVAALGLIPELGGLCFALAASSGKCKCNN